VEKKWVFEENTPGVSPYSDFNGVQRVEGPDVSFSAASKSRHDPAEE